MTPRFTNALPHEIYASDIRSSISCIALIFILLILSTENNHDPILAIVEFAPNQKVHYFKTTRPRSITDITIRLSVTQLHYEMSNMPKHVGMVVGR